MSIVLLINHHDICLQRRPTLTPCAPAATDSSLTPKPPSATCSTTVLTETQLKSLAPPDSTLTNTLVPACGPTQPRDKDASRTTVSTLISLVIISLLRIVVPNPIHPVDKALQLLHEELQTATFVIFSASPAF